MNTSSTSLITEKAAKLPILIVDKNGFLGTRLADDLCRDVQVVVVTGGTPKTHKNIIAIPYLRRIPIIPDHTYSHIIVVYNGELEMFDLLPVFVQKAKEATSKLIFVCSLAVSTPKLFKAIAAQHNFPMQIVVYGQPFDETEVFSNTSSNLLHAAASEGKVIVANSGLDPLFPLYMQDILFGIRGVVFEAAKRFAIYYLFPSFPITQLSFARMIQKHAPLLKIDFKRQKIGKNKYHIPPDGIFIYPKYALDERIKLFRFVQKEKQEGKPKKRIVKPRDPQSISRTIVLLSTLAFSLFIAPILFTAIFVLSGAGLLSWSFQQIEAGKRDTAQNIASAADYSFAAAEALIPGLVLPLTTFPDQTESIRQSIKTGREVIVLQKDLLSAATLVQDITDKRSVDPKDDFLKATAIMKNSLLTVQKLQAEKNLPSGIQKKLEDYQGVLRLAEGTIDVWPSLFGFEGKKSYLILFQNNMELRPGGGFIGSFGLTGVENGIFEKLTIYDVYDADGKLKTHINPPYGLQRYMGSSHWTMRDSNFSVDFLTNAQEASRFLEMELGKKVDGVVAIDTTFLKGLLSVLGPITLSEYKQTVTPDNFYLMTQTQVEKDFFPGSTQKKDFLRSLMNAMMTRLEERSFSWGQMSSIIENAALEKHLMFASKDTAEQDAFSLNGLSSSLIDTRKKEDKNIFWDYLGVVDANIGGNKANYYVTRSIDHTVRFDKEGTMQGSVAISYTNKSTLQSPFGWDYKNYIRLILPKGAEIQSLFFDGEEQVVLPAVMDPQAFTSPSFTPPSGLEVEESEGFEKSLFGLYMIVPTNSTKKLVVSYRLPEAMDTTDPAFEYKLYLYKQPGILNTPYLLTVTYPENMRLVKGDKSTIDLGGKFTYETDMATDTAISTTFSRK